MQTVKMVVTGPFSAGKTEFIQSVSEIDVVATERKISNKAEQSVKEATTVAMDFGRITVDEDLVLYLFGTPGQKRFDFMWEILSEGMLGFIVMVDSTRPETFREARSILETFRAYAPTPYVVAANKQDIEDAWDMEDMRHALRLESTTKFLPCVATDKDTVKSVLLELLYNILAEMEAGGEARQLFFVSSITTDQGIVHYEVYGRGKPVILLHGWLGSWGLWQETMGYLGQYYRTYAMDFWGFGESGKKRETYAVQDFVGLVDQFMEQLGIVRAPLVGHSMGGTVSLSVAIRYPERVSKVVVVGSPIYGSSLAPLLKIAGYRISAFMIFNMMGVFRAFMKYYYSRVICSDPRFPAMMDSDLSKTTVESFLLSIASLRRTDLRPMLDNIKVPAMGVYGDKDVVVHPKQWQPMQKGIPHAQIERFPMAGHFVMLEEHKSFSEKLKAFLDEEENIPPVVPQSQAPPLDQATSVTLAP